MPEFSTHQWVDRLTSAARSGQVLDLAPGVSDNELNPGLSAYWPPERIVPAEAIRRTLLNRDLAPDPHGLRVRGGRIIGVLDLSFATLPCRLRLEKSAIEDVDLRSAQLVALSLNGSHVQSVFLDRTVVQAHVTAIGMTTRGEVSAKGAQIGGQLNLRAATLINNGGNALSLDTASVSGGLFASRLTTLGACRAHASHIGAQVDLCEATLCNVGGDAFIFDGARIRGDVIARRLHAFGRVHGIGAQIEGPLDVAGSHLNNTGGEALNLDGADIAGGINAAKLRAAGELHAYNASIGAELNLAGASLTQQGNAIALDGTRVKGGVVASGLIAHGGFRARAVHIDGQLVVTKATLRNPGGNAIDLQTASISGGVLALGLTALGSIHAPGSQIKGHLDLKGAALANEGGHALNLEGASVEIFLLKQAGDWRGAIILSWCELRLLVVDDAYQGPLPGPLSAVGWSVGDVHGFLRHNRKAASSWLESIPTNAGFVTQPWEELAKVYERNGQPADALRLRYTAARRFTKRASGFTKVIRSIYGVLVGYGYYPLLAIPWLLLLYAFACGLAAANPNAFSPSGPTAARSMQAESAHGSSATCPTDGQPITGATDPGCLAPGYPTFEPWQQALAVTAPASVLAPLAWAPTTAWIAILLTLCKVGSWLLSALLLAAVTLLLRRH